ncbi:hypothetical protein Tco_0168248 [Tanacetum coccineum]
MEVISHTHVRTEVLHESRITAVEQYVKHHKTSSIRYDSPLNNVFSDTMRIDHDIKNSDNRAALMNKIMDMEVEFQRRITTVKQYLKIPTSSNIEKPSCGSDNLVKHGDKESMYVDRDVKTSCVFDLNAKNVDNDYMDVDHDPKVASKNLINDEDLEEPHVAGKNFIDEDDQQVSSKNLEVPLKGEELFAVRSLMQMIDFDISKEQMHNQLPTQPMMTEATVQGCNNGETAQSMITDAQS